MGKNEEDLQKELQNAGLEVHYANDNVIDEISNFDTKESNIDIQNDEDTSKNESADTSTEYEQPEPDTELINDVDATNDINSWLIELDDPLEGTKRLKSLQPTDNFSKSLHQLLDTFLSEGYVVPEQLPTSPDPNKTIIKLGHKTQNVSREKIVHQTIKYSMVDSSKAPNNIKRQLVFIQNGVKDKVTNEITWDDEPQTQAFSEMPSPIKRGYVPDEEIVPEQEITVTNKNFNISLDKVWLINYQRELLTIRIKVIDDDKGEVLNDYSSKGYDGDVLNVTSANLAKEFKKKHYLINQSDLPEKLVFESGQSPIYNVHLVHERGPIQDASSLKTRGTYTINFVDKNKNELRKPIELVQFYERKAQEDYVTGQVDYGVWDKTTHLPEIKIIPSKLDDGNGNDLIPLTTKIIIPDVAPNTEEQVEAIYYAPEQIIDLHFKYEGKVVNKMTLKFGLREDCTIDLKQKTADLIKSGYKISNNQTAPLTYSYDASQDDHREYDIQVRPIIKNTIENKIVKRVIIVVTPNGAKRSITNSAVIKRNVTIDLSTGKKEYGPWSQNLWDSYTPPKMTNYVPNQLKVEEVLVNGDTKDTKIKINYVPFNAPAARNAVETETKPKTLLEHIKSFFKSDSDDNNNQLQLDAPKNEKNLDA